MTIPTARIVEFNLYFDQEARSTEVIIFLMQFTIIFQVPSEKKRKEKR